MFTCITLFYNLEAALDSSRVAFLEDQFQRYTPYLATL